MVVAAWLVAIVAAYGALEAVGSHYSDNLVLPNTQSYEASSLLARASVRATGDTDQIVFAVSRGTVRSASVRRDAEALFARIARLPHVIRVDSPFADGARGQIARSGRIAFADVQFGVGASQLPSEEAERYVALVMGASHGDLQYQASGSVAENGSQSGLSLGLPIGFLAAGVVLFLVFGTLLATLLPLLTAAVSLGAAIAVIGLLSNLMNMASFASQLALLIGLGVGVDYALFIVTRYRQSRLRGLPSEEAVVQAIDTSGRSVMFAGLTVCIAMLGMFALGVSFLYGVAVAAALTVAFTVVAALTLLPALLALFGAGALRRRERRAIASRLLLTTEDSPGWRRWTGVLQRRPAALGAAAIVLMLVIGLPLTSMRLGSADASSDPSSSTTFKAYEILARGFGAGYNGPIVLVASVSSSEQRAEFDAVIATTARVRGVATVTPATVLPTRGSASVASAEVYSRYSPQAVATANLVSALRSRVIPAAERGTGLHVLVGGQTATFNDVATVLSQKLPLFIAIVVGVSCLLLTAVFRSLTIPVTAAVMNLLSTGASLGIVTAVFQFGWLGGVLGISPGPIESFLPVLLFPILFGLSMDYEVFLVSRIREEWGRRGDNRAAVADGLAATGKTINAAAAIMVLVFAAFILGGQRVIELFGVGLASAVLLDAVVVRSIIVPSAMLLVGDANWHLPRLLAKRLPHLRIEGSLPARLPPPQASSPAAG